jgi:hypothetical protein
MLVAQFACHWVHARTYPELRGWRRYRAGPCWREWRVALRWCSVGALVVTVRNVVLMLSWWWSGMEQGGQREKEEVGRNRKGKARELVLCCVLHGPCFTERYHLCLAGDIEIT